MVAAKLPIEKLIDYSYSDYAQKQLGSFKLEHDDGKPGCR
jgi:hypothetical protein